MKAKELTPHASKAARALLDWKQQKLAEAAGVGLSTVVDFEKNRRPVSSESVAKMQTALENAGIEVLNGKSPGARLKRS